MINKEKECVARLKEESDKVLERYSGLLEKAKLNERLNGWEELNSGPIFKKMHSLSNKAKKINLSNLGTLSPKIQLRSRSRLKVNKTNSEKKPARLQFYSSNLRLHESKNYSENYINKFIHKTKAQKLLNLLKNTSESLQETTRNFIKINSILPENSPKTEPKPRFLIKNSRITVKKSSFIEKFLKG